MDISTSLAKKWETPILSDAIDRAIPGMWTSEDEGRLPVKQTIDKVENK
jgi:hypothetical protein